MCAQVVRINGLHFYRENPSGLILYFHGNSRSIKGWAKYAKDFLPLQLLRSAGGFPGLWKKHRKEEVKGDADDMQFVYETLLKTYPEQQSLCTVVVLAVALPVRCS